MSSLDVVSIHELERGPSIVYNALKLRLLDVSVSSELRKYQGFFFSLIGSKT